MRQEQKRPVINRPHADADQATGVGAAEVQVPESDEALADVDAALEKARALERQLLQSARKRGCCGCGC